MNTNYAELLDFYGQGGCNYYNIDNRDNRNNIYTSDSISAGLRPLASEEHVLPGQGQSVSRQGLLDPRAQVPKITKIENQTVKSSISQFIDNGEDARRRFKFKIRLNLITGTNVDFIANMTKSIQDFKRHIPGPYMEILELAREVRRDVKQRLDIIPYIGKFHLRSIGTRINIEPDTFVAVWYNREDAGWEGLLKIQNWIQEFSLCDTTISVKQATIGVKAQWVYKNPNYDKETRPKTYAQLIKEAK